MVVTCAELSEADCQAVSLPVADVVTCTVNIYVFYCSCDEGSSVGIVTSRDRFPAGVKDLSLIQHLPDRLWGPTSILSNGYRGLFPGGKAVRP
jgi:hypothetical protein